MFAVEPKHDCPHCDAIATAQPWDQLLNAEFFLSPCKDCGNVGENWVCLECAYVGCSRYVNEHMVHHIASSSHAVALSFSDLSFWCFQCESYVTTALLRAIRAKAEIAKFPTTETETSSDDAQQQQQQPSQELLDNLISALQNMGMGVSLAEEQPATASTTTSTTTESPESVEKAPSADEMIDNLKQGRYKKVIVMSGAGISTDAGIPDFRSPETGLYHNLEKYNLPEPTAVFDIDFFRKNPKPFFELCKGLYPSPWQFEPTASHHFIKLLADKGLLLRNYTQNIDLLERVANIDPEYLVEAHGTFATAHCDNKDCRKQYDAPYVRAAMMKDAVPTCELCNSVVKPDVVFFGEMLPSRFTETLEADFDQCDLLIIMGTSLKVHPFAGLINRVSDSCHRLLLNRDPVGQVPKSIEGVKNAPGLRFNRRRNRRDAALLGNLTDNVKKLCAAAGWEQELQQSISELHAQFEAHRNEPQQQSTSSSSL